MSGNSTQENDIVVSNIVVSNSGGESTTNNFAYKKLLQSLQSIPISSQEPADDTTADTEEKTESIAQSTNNTWDLSTDAQLATLLNEITNHITARTQHVSRDIRQLQQEVNNVGVNVALVRTQFMKRSNEIFMEQVVGDDEEESISLDEKDQNTDESTMQKNDTNIEQDDDDAIIKRLELEEQAAINDGMEVLKLFFDAKRRPQQGSDSESGGNNNQIVESAEDDMVGDDCYYYAAAEGDMINQRPLPFIIGSREFVESIASNGGSTEQQD